jgi:hypothetical protein
VRFRGLCGYGIHERNADLCTRRTRDAKIHHTKACVGKVNRKHRVKNVASAPRCHGLSESNVFVIGNISSLWGLWIIAQNGSSWVKLSQMDIRTAMM